MRRKILAASVLILTAVLNAAAGVPPQLTYQGWVWESTTPINASRNIEILICDAETGGTCHTSGTQTVDVSSNIFRSVFNVPAAVDLTTGNWFTEARIAGNPLRARDRMTSRAYTLFASTAVYAFSTPLASSATFAYNAGYALLATSATIANTVLDGVITDAKVASVSASKLTGQLPALDGSLLTNLPAAGGAVAKTGDVMTGTLSLPAGNAVSPTLSFTGDLNTGVYSPEADKVALTAGGSEKLSAGAALITASVPLTVDGELGLGNGTQTGNKPFVVWLKNASGGERVYGELVVISPAEDLAFECQASTGVKTVLGAVYDAAIADGATGRVAVHGVADVMIADSVTRGQAVINGGSCRAGSEPNPIDNAAGKWLQSGGSDGSLKKALLLSH